MSFEWNETIQKMYDLEESDAAGLSEFNTLLGGNVSYKLTGADFDLEFSAPKAATREELGKILEELASGLQGEEVPHPGLF